MIGTEKMVFLGKVFYKSTQRYSANILAGVLQNYLGQFSKILGGVMQKY